MIIQKAKSTYSGENFTEFQTSFSTGTSAARADPLRVLLVTARYLPFVGGTETHNYEVARRLAASGNDVTVLTTDPSSQLPTFEESEGIKIIRVRAWPSKGDYYFAPGIYRTITQGRWDIIHCQGYHTLVAPLAMLAAWRSKTPYVVTFHSGGHTSQFRNALRGVQSMILRPLLARAERLVAVSKFEANLFRKRLRFPAQKFLVIPNGSELPKVTAPAQTDGTLIISAGRLERYKGHHRVIAALPRVLAQCPEARLRIIGSGPFEKQLRRIAEQLGVADRVEIGAIPAGDREGMNRLLSSAALVTLLSEYESQGLVVMEALALGCSILVANTSALSDLVRQGLVHGVSLNSTPETLAGAILDHLYERHNPADLTLPTWEDCTADLLTLYHSVKKAARPKPKSSNFQPAQLLEVEISRPLPAVSAANEQTGQIYRRAMSLVRLHGRPLGMLELELSEAGLNAADYARQIWQALSQDITEHLQQDGLPAVTQLEATGIASSSVPGCVQERDNLLTTAPFVSVVVCTRNRPRRVAACLDSLLAADYPRYEIIVVDNAPSSDATADLIKQKYGNLQSVRYVREDRRGLSWARNRGIMEARGEIVAYTDDDILVDSHWLAELVKGFSAAQDVACVTGVILPTELETAAQSWLEQYGGFSKGFKRRIFDMVDHRDGSPLFPYNAGLYGSGANMAFKKSFLQEVGGFDPLLGTGSPTFGGDDLAAFFMVLIKGYKLCYEPAAIVHHMHYRDYADLRRQVYGYGVGLTAFLMNCLLEDPKRIFELLLRMPYGLFFTFSLQSPKNAKKQPDYPKELTRIELQGMLYGPFGYLRSYREARRITRQFGPLAGRSLSPLPSRTEA